MNREDRIKLAIAKGYTCDPKTGLVYGPSKKVISRTQSGYISFFCNTPEKRYTIRAHQFIWYWVHKDVVDCIDHINQNRKDNRIDNLRSVTNQENLFNTKNKGYSYDKLRDKWKAYIKIDGRTIQIGRYPTMEEAKAAREAAKEKYHIIGEKQRI